MISDQSLLLSTIILNDTTVLNDDISCLAHYLRALRPESFYLLL